MKLNYIIQGLIFVLVLNGQTSAAMLANVVGGDHDDTVAGAGVKHPEPGAKCSEATLKQAKDCKCDEHKVAHFSDGESVAYAFFQAKQGASLINVAVTLDAYIDDKLYAHQCTFTKTLYVFRPCEVIDLSSCLVNNVIINTKCACLCGCLCCCSVGQEGRQPMLHLNKTKVQGTITFVGTQGKVIIEQALDDKVPTVVNGAIEKRVSAEYHGPGGDL